MDGSTNSEYCSTCFQKGTYTDPDETLETMMEKTEMNMIENLHFPTARAHDLVEEITPKLKRWKRL
ncbi:MAG: hypothetical protein A3H69_05810 [Candidatus Sungbacteria bacterium RIFCSPLOWO2_02_FULL_47_9]|uniref:Putative zinc ribbon domain-containing protein n=1 Tax=Candidatus Sungbacteria bacterium RIFCSPHIGHO2_01_FULL_47_32 TaxID=1802264 RepID=A0A1G2K588_9BACT|nr:MAG: hypothetical protein A2633_04585 [Candidatus Sungbacteria bacterium RIFCSPHIGHO2_01_FULL_47_32]OHA05493.1 MAG: hypothetical protein A3A28_03045 [Candidatus Sungbacteria bacterium RIFCSPLOWO2_01_FULL_47_32]OHA08672.1 MAG: hypothetical protein A3H69_05810 [Candidatus Sungbacteria bacterium RIFCSPLOWO2_02_FULL_47_9]